MTRVVFLGSLFVCMVLLSSCTTYATFYGDTATIIGEKVNIKRLDLSYQDLKQLPEQFDQLNELRMLNLSGNTALDIEAILNRVAAPEKLTVLLLDSLQLQELPANISRFENLRQLSLVQNPNIEWSTAFDQLENLPLIFLNLERNKINALPKNIEKLTLLRDLKLSYNHLGDEDSYVYLSHLPDLYALWIDFNDLDKVPENLGLLTQIKYLYMDANRLSDLPETMRHMESLSVIHLGYNDFTQLPTLFMKMPGLLMVHINNNQITAIPRSYGSEKYSLLALLLDNNPIPDSEVQWAKKALNRYFLLSFQQPIFKID